MNAIMSKALTAILLLSCAAPLGCGALIPSLAPEEKAQLDEFAKRYNDTAAASKKSLDTNEAYFNAIVVAASCADKTKLALADQWMAETVDGKMSVEQAREKCAEMLTALRKKDSGEQGCGFASLRVQGGQQRPGMDWTTTVSGALNFDTVERVNLRAQDDGSRELTACDKVPEKGTTPAPIWKPELVKEAERMCGEGAIILYTGTDWKTNEASSTDGDHYLIRYLDAECWYPKGTVGKDYKVPAECESGDTPPEPNRSCITPAGKLVLK
jgi:hypothetical protein